MLNHLGSSWPLARISRIKRLKTSNKTNVWIRERRLKDWRMRRRRRRRKEIKIWEKEKEK